MGPRSKSGEELLDSQRVVDSKWGVLFLVFNDYGVWYIPRLNLGVVDSIKALQCREVAWDFICYISLWHIIKKEHSALMVVKL